MVSKNTNDDAILRDTARKLFLKATHGHDLTDSEVNTMKVAYHADVLPKHFEYNVYEWVENGCPMLCC